MSILQYKKVLNIAEALLTKVDIPQETMIKYEELKLRLLGDTTLDGTPLAATLGPVRNEELELTKYQNTIDNEIVSIYSNFLGSMSNIFDVNLNMNGQHGSSSAFQDYLTPFYQSFDEKKVQVRDAILESTLEPANRLILSQKLKQLDLIGSNFDVVIKKLSGFQENLDLKNQIESQLETKIQQLEQELSTSLYNLETARAALEQVDILKGRNNDLEIKLDEINLDNQKVQLKMNSQIEQLVSELGETRQIFDESSELNKNLRNEIDKLDEERDQFCEVFSKFCTQYQTEEQGIDSKNFAEVSAFLLQFVEKLESDNQWFEKAVAENTQVLNETQENLSKAQQEASCNTGFAQEIESLAQTSKNTLGEIEMMSTEFKELVEQGLGMKQLLISGQ